MKKFLMAVAAVALMGSVALAGPNAGGTIFAHDPAHAYTTDSNVYCGLGTAPSSCEGADVEIDGGALSLWKVYAAFPQNSSPRLKGMSWGIHFNSNDVVILDKGNCCGDPNNGATEFPGPGWPGDNTGTAMVWQFTQTTQLVECYWFGGYNYSGAASIFQLRDNPDPGLGGKFADDSVPSQLDDIAGYGSLGFNEPGLTNCPPPPGQNGACCIQGVCTITTQPDCQGQYMGDGTTCDPNPCPPLGACCIGEACTLTLQTECQGTWNGAPSCDPNPCIPTPTGACCLVDQTCIVTTQVDCPTGDWRENVPCDPNPCVVPTQESTWGQIKNNYK